MGKRSTSRKQKMLEALAANKHPKLLSRDPESSKARAALEKQMMKQLLRGELESSKAGAAIDNKTEWTSRELVESSEASGFVTDEKLVRQFRLLCGLPESLDDESCEDITDERSDDYDSRMLMRAAVETLKENKLLRVCRQKKLCLKVPEDKVDHLLNMLRSEVQMKSDLGFEELKQVEAAAKYIYARKMFKVEFRGGEKFMQIPHSKMSRVGPGRYGFDVSLVQEPTQEVAIL